MRLKAGRSLKETLETQRQGGKGEGRDWYGSRDRLRGREMSEIHRNINTGSVQGVITGGGEWRTEALKQRGTKNHRDTQRQRDKEKRSVHRENRRMTRKTTTEKQTHRQEIEFYIYIYRYRYRERERLKETCRDKKHGYTRIRDRRKSYTQSGRDTETGRQRQRDRHREIDTEIKETCRIREYEERAIVGVGGRQSQKDTDRDQKIWRQRQGRRHRERDRETEAGKETD